MIEQTPAVIITDLHFAYNGETVLRDVNLTIEVRDFVTIVGPNGGGKTTLLKLILGLLKPQHGAVSVMGRTPDRTRARIGYMPQHADFDQQFPITVQEVVLTGRLHEHRWFGRYNRRDREAVQKALAEVDLQDFLTRPFSALSGGQRKRVLIARALVTNPDLLILDEPTANLDPSAEQDLYRLLHRLNKNLTILMVSHDLNFVSSFVNRVVCVNRKVVVHPTGDVPAEMGAEFYGREMRVILHDQHRNGREVKC
ncbi:MAG TPA: ABC transporter ATP-binding protein [bacterium]|nr:ABC transporter ATP-binding protein [bacterium]